MWRGGTSLAIQWLRLCTAHAGGSGFDLWSETRSHVPQLKNPASATKTWSTQIDEHVNKYIFKNANIWRGRERATQNCKISLEENTHR